MNDLSTQKFLAMDLEMNQPSGKIIQIGVAIGTITQSHRDYVVRQWLIDPIEKIAPEITALTGISDADIQSNAVAHNVAAQELSDLIVTHQPFLNPVTWGHGDSDQWLDELRARNIEFHHFGRRWIDTKTMHLTLTLAQGKSWKGGLSSAMGKYKLSFHGQAHRADVDAINTLRLFAHMMRRQQAIESASIKIASAVNQSS